MLVYKQARIGNIVIVTVMVGAHLGLAFSVMVGAHLGLALTLPISS